MTQNWRKLTKHFDLRHTAREKSIIKVTEVSQMTRLPVVKNRRLPHLHVFSPPYSNVATFVVASCFTILSVLLISCNAKIITTVIQCIAILMITFNRWICQAKDQTVHQFSMSLSGIIAFGPGVPISIPRPLHQPFVISNIDSCNLAFCQWNKFDRLIERLDNRLALDATLGHNLTLNEIAVFNRFFIIPSYAGGL